jgi:hypothetical protein
MDKITKTILVAFYVLQVCVACREQLMHVYEQTAEALAPQAVHVRQVVQDVVLKDVMEARGPTSNVSISAVDTALSHLPVALAAVEHVVHPMHSHDGDKRHDKDRVRRNRRLHKYSGPFRYYDNLAMSIAAIRPAVGHDMAYVTAPVRRNLYGLG